MAAHTPETHETDGDNIHHVTSLRLLIMTGVALLILTWLTVGVSFIDLGPVNDIVALVIAITKALLIVFIFMGLRWASSVPKLLLLLGIFILLVLFVGTINELMTRIWVAIPGH